MKKTQESKLKQLTPVKLKFLLAGRFFLITFFILYPAFFYSYILVPDDVKQISLLGITYTSLYFESIQIFVWTLLGKLLPLLALSFWYLSYKKIWINVLHIPIGMYVFQIIRLILQDALNFDTFEFFFILPFMVAYSIILYYYKNYLKRQIEKFEYEKELVKLGTKVLLNTNEKED